MKGSIIFLNGPSSAGKTTLTYALQTKLDEIYYRISSDDFMKMVDRQKMHDNFYTRLGEALTAMHHTIKLYSDRGLNVIVDHVLLETPEEKYMTPECVGLLYEHPILFIRVDCDLEELEHREKNRGDRQIGQAKSQLENMHSQNIYDLHINTFRQSTDECVNKISEKLAQPEKWNAFHILNKHFFGKKL
jgi:chloramphenicol 3-O phosphotransferase